MPESARIDGLAVVVLLVAIVGFIFLARLVGSPPETVVRDTEGHAIDPAELESDEPPELKAQAEQQERESRWRALTRTLRPWGSGGWWWWRGR